MSFDNKKLKSFVTDSAYLFTTILPLALSMAVCSGFGAPSAIIASALACLLVTFNKTKLIMPVFASYLIVSFTFKEYGVSTAALAIALGGAAMIILALLGFDFKQIIFKPVTIAIMLATAITVTVLETTHYFGIGATGNIVEQMISSYRSLGFHPNWRGILFGTIVLVLMITYPRKFKKADKVVNASFVALAVTLALNLILNPADMISPIKEIGTYSLDFKEVLLPAFKAKISLTGVLTSGFALFFTTAFSVADFKGDNLDYAVTGATNCFCSVFSGAFMPVTAMTHKRKNFAGIPAAILCVAVLLLCSKFIARIPLSSCAVILIVGAWQSVKWSAIKKAFIDVPSLACFIAVVAFMLLFGAVKGILFGALCSFICSFLPSAKHFIND